MEMPMTNQMTINKTVDILVNTIQKNDSEQPKENLIEG